MANATTDEPQAEQTGFIKRQFDGIAFLWHTPGTRHLLKLIALLFGSMIVSFTVLVLAQVVLGDLSILVRLTFYLQLYSLAFFVFIFVELLQFYRNDRKYKSFPEMNPLLKMKYWPKTSGKRYGTIIFGLILVICVSFIVVYGEFFDRWFLISVKNSEYLFEVGYLFFLCFLLFLAAFITAKGSIESSKARYTERIHHGKLWFLLLLPVPWILLGIVFYTAGIASEITVVFGFIGDFWNLAALFTFGFLCLVGLIAIFNRKMRTSYTTSQIAASSTFLFVIIIPGMIGTITGSLGSARALSLGPVISLAAMAFFYFRGNLDEEGHDLRKYYTAWDKKLKQFNITSEEDVLKQKYDKRFETTPLTTAVANAYHDLILGLLLLLLTYFGFIYCIAPEFSILGIAVGIEQIDLLLQVDSWFEIIGLTLGIIVFTVISVFRKPKRTENA